MVAQSVADVFVAEMAAAGIRRMYGIVGDSLNPLSDALRRSGSIEFIHVRHEESAAFAAGAEAQLSGLPVACAGSSGPGHVHLVNGLYDCQRSYAPVLALASMIPTATHGLGYFQETHPQLLFRDCSCYNEHVASPQQVPHMLRHALQSAISRRGVAVLSVPGDVLAMEAVGASQAPQYVFPEPSRPHSDSVHKLAEAINSAKSVTLYCGSGCQDAADVILELARKIKAPVAYAWRGKQWIEPENPYAVGMIGFVGFGGATYAIHQCELLLLLGTDMPFSGLYPKDVLKIQVDVRSEHLGRRTDIAMGIHADVGVLVQEVLPLVHEKSSTAHLESALQQTQTSRDTLQQAIVEGIKGEKIRPEALTDAINKYAARDAIFTIDTGLNSIWAARYLHATYERRFLGSFTHGSMGSALPMSLGAQLLHPERQVVALCGDGSMGMCMGELLTIAQYKLPVKIFLYNNGCLGFINYEMKLEGYSRFATELVNPDFARIAQTIGMTGIRVTKTEELEEAVKRAFMTEGAVFVDVCTDPERMP